MATTRCLGWPGLIGGLGEDRLDGGTGSDTLSGGQGNDVYIVDIATAVVIEGTDAGIDTVEASVSYNAEL